MFMKKRAPIATVLSLCMAVQSIFSFPSAAQTNTAKAIEIPAALSYTTVGWSPVLTALEGSTQQAVMLECEKTISWNFSVQTAGEYFLTVRYLPVKGENNDAQLTCDILQEGGDASMELTFPRVWKNESPVKTDQLGNETRPTQVEVESPSFIIVSEKLAQDFTSFQLKEGNATLKLTAKQQRVGLISFTLTPKSHTSYSVYRNRLSDTATGTGTIWMEGEDADYKSSSSLYPIPDYSSAETSPSHPYLTKLNTIGGDNWIYDKQWLEWNFNAPVDGFYTINMRVKQSSRAGQSSFRRIYIDGDVPFDELNSVAVSYAGDWQTVTPGNENGAYQIYLKAGLHTLRIENTIGDIGDVFRLTTDLNQKLNSLYRKILVYVGTTPDADRDYKLEELIPDLRQVIEELISDLDYIMSEMLKITENRGEDYARFDDLQKQLKLFLQSTKRIPEQFDQFLTNIRSLSEWLFSAQQQSLTIDYIELRTQDTPTEYVEKSFTERIWFHIQSFFATFFMDYSSLSGGETSGEPVSVWVASGSINGATASTGNMAGFYVTVGRDHAQALNEIVQNYFTPKTGISVEVKLVDANVLIPAVAVGDGPDASVLIASKHAMDYGFRGALYDLTSFADYEQTVASYAKEPLVPFTYEGRTYALPDTYVFNLMFYRKDILKEIGASAPNTWDEMLTLLPKFNNNNLTLGIAGLASESLETYMMLLYQMGITPYDEAGTHSLFATETGIAAFDFWGSLYTKYDVPKTADLLTFFRTGQMPIIIAPYLFYNSLQAGAPEIDGLWDATIVPGMASDDGTVNHSVAGYSTGAVIFSNAKQPDRAWEFIKWWTGEEGQTLFGQEVESAQGKSGRMAVANPKALQKLSWGTDAVSVIRRQMDMSKAIPEVPGGYMSMRYIPTAMSLVANNSAYLRDTLIQYAALVDEEITTKRKEFKFE